MHFAASIIAALAAAVMAAAQTTIMVGGDANTPGGIFQFIPPNITATNGTVVTFMYSGSPGNHTVVQSTFSNPCQQMAGGFDSGFIFVPQNTTSGFPTWNLTITNDQEPIWFYCAQLAPSPHCNAGMVGSINAQNDTFATFQAAAISATSVLPGNPTPNLAGVGASASVAPGPFTGSITGFNVPTGSAAASSASSGASSASSTTPASASSAPATTTSASAASLNAVNGFAVFIASLFGIVLL